MPDYELLFRHDFAMDDDLVEGAALRYKGEVWHVDLVDVREGEATRVWLSPWPAGVPYPLRVFGEGSTPDLSF